MTTPEPRRAEVDDNGGPVVEALLDLFGLLDAEDWDALVAHLDDDVQLADELTGSWLRGREAVAGYLWAQRGVVTLIRSRLDDVRVTPLSEATSLVTFHMRQSYRLVGQQRSEVLTGCVILRGQGADWSLLLFDLGSISLPEDSSHAGVEPVDAGSGEVEAAVSLGERIKALRTERGVSLRGLAERASMSAGFLSEVERNLADPSVASLLRIAEALGVAAASLVEEPRVADRLVVSSRTRRTSVPLGTTGLSLSTLDGPPGSRLAGHLRTITPAARSNAELDEIAPSDSLLFVLQGQGTLEHRGKVVPLAEQDAVLLLAGTPYRLRPSGSVALNVLVVSGGGDPPVGANGRA